MFASVEKYKGPAKVLLGLIALTFVGFGFSTVVAPGSDYVVKIGGHKISQQDVLYGQESARADGRSADAGAQKVLQDLVQRAYLIEGAEDAGLAVSTAEIQQLIVDDPLFHDEQGRFSQEKFKRYLSQRRLSEEQFADDIRRRFTLQNLGQLMQEGNLVSDAQAVQVANLLQAEYRVRSVYFNPRDYEGQVKAEEAELKAYYEANQARYIRPQAVKFESITLSLADLAAKQQVDTSEVDKAWEAQKLAGMMKKRMAHIMLNLPTDQAEAAKVRAEAARLLAHVKARPADFAKLSREKSQDASSALIGGSLGLVGADSLFSDDFKTRLLALQPGEIALLESEYAVHIVKVEAETAADLAQQRAQIGAQLRLQKAQRQFAAEREKLAQEAFAANNDLAAVAQKFGLKLEKNDAWLTQDEARQRKMSELLVAELFNEQALQNRQNSEPLAVTDDKVQVVRVSDVRPEQLMAYEQVKNNVYRDYVTQQARNSAEEKAKQVMADLQNGQAVKLDWTPSQNFSVSDASLILSFEYFQQLLKTRPQPDKPAYMLFWTDLPLGVLMEIQSLKLPEKVAEDELKQVKELLSQRQNNQVFNRLMVYLQEKIEQKPGRQKLEADQ